MPLESDLRLDTTALQESSQSEKIKNLNVVIERLTSEGPKWYEVGAEKYRKMRWNGETSLPKPKVIASGVNFEIPSRDPGRKLPCRMFKPETGPSKGVFMHIHGGGWVLQTEAYQDMLLKFIADNAHVTVVSVGYRLAPEHPFPAGPEDCYDGAEYLVDNAEKEFGGKLLFAGGESAGGHLSALVCFHLLKARPSFAFRALILNCGVYDLSFLPQARNFTRPLVLAPDIMDKYLEAFCPGMAGDKRKRSDLSPLYFDMRGVKLPPALLTCGTEDCLMDDTIFMGSKWLMSGAEAVVKLYPGCPHAFVLFDPNEVQEAAACLEDIRTFLVEHS